MRYRLEYALAWVLLKLVGVLPRPLARGAGITLAWTVYLLHGKLRRVGMRNLELAFPEKSARERGAILRGVFTSLGRQVAEVCLFPRYTRENVTKTVVYEGFENFERALARGKGVLFLTAHLGAWELSAFAHSLYGYPLIIVMRPLDNPYLDRLARDFRTMHGNKVVDKDFARGLIRAMRKGETVGVLMDTNTIASQGVFVDFFGIAASTASGIARVALKTDAAVVPGFTIWDPVLAKYRLRFDPALKLLRTGNTKVDVMENTALYTKIIEEYVRRYPDQWLWVHRRWKTRPQGEKGLY
ncbi:MAG: lysophospholipid acyltransferase family protein [Acidobacteria bacterium]|nr:lysophospholipid acyltransferase family protein [Acidobacteriota bacterium]MBV9624726.1 lysophospholipid acyltransferase family protein [Acidobacteriota bacterium]